MGVSGGLVKDGTMYQIDRDTNNILRVTERRFSDLGFRERENLQEWIAKNPDVLGEDLLIIQKEFDGFSDTNERLDLLALDKDGNLVVIENKLDDTGRDVVWQALKYASYCSTLSTSQIVKMYQRYLSSTGSEDDAQANIEEFLAIEDDDSLLLNREDQRIFFVANNYRKEVTSTVLWLLDHDLKIKCFKATPYSLEKDLFLKIDQIIPMPEVSDFMIEIKEKVREDKGKSKRVKESEADLLDFWQLVKGRFTDLGVQYFENIKAKPQYHMGFTKGRGYFAMVIGKEGPRVELYFPNDAEKSSFDAMTEFKVELNAAFAGRLQWQRLDNKKASRIKYEVSWKEIMDGRPSGDLSARSDQIEWFVKELPNFFTTIYPYWARAQSS